MADHTWPSNVPQDIRIPTEFDQKDRVLSTKMSSGPNKKRLRYSATESPLRTTMMMNGQEYINLKDWYNNTINAVNRFDWTDPISGNTVEMRFESFPRGRIISGGETPADRTVLVTLELEIMP